MLILRRREGWSYTTGREECLWRHDVIGMFLSSFLYNLIVNGQVLQLQPEKRTLTGGLDSLGMKASHQDTQRCQQRVRGI